MIIIAINLTLIELIAFPAVTIIFGITIYFFIKSRRSLKQTLKAINGLSPKKESAKNFKRSEIVVFEEQFAKKRYEAYTARHEEVVLTKRKNYHEENLVQEMKATIEQQQKMLDVYLAKVEEAENEGRQKLVNANEKLEDEIIRLELVIEEKNEKIEGLKQQAAMTEKMTAKVEEVYREFDLLQSKMNVLEKQANRANSLAIELEETKESFEQIHKELVRKQEKLEEVMNDSHRMRQEMNTLEDKLSEANLQRQQLQKKVLFLTDLNNDMQSIYETNKKLQTEIRRIGELESMLNMMAEERDFLLRNRQSNNRSSL